MRYWLRLPANFAWVKGGKLPGLYGGRVISGGNIPDGTNGFSTRLMWRVDGQGELYLYGPTSSRYGTSLGRGSWNFVRERWQCIEQEVVLNTPGQLDGTVRIWVDGDMAYENTRLLFRTVNTLQIEGVFFSTFYGGGRSILGAARTRADFAHFAVGLQRVGC